MPASRKRERAALTRRLTAREADLWRAVARSVSPLPGRARDVEAAPRPIAAAPSPAAASALAPRTSPALARPAPDRGGEKRVRRGRLEIAASIDLHGYTAGRAQAALAAFLARAHGEGARVVIVVTGKGRAGEPGVLRRRLPAWLDAPQTRPLISGFAQAHRKHGGAGAFYVFLKRPREA